MAEFKPSHKAEILSQLKIQEKANVDCKNQLNTLVNKISKAQKSLNSDLENFDAMKNEIIQLRMEQMGKDSAVAVHEIDRL